MFETTLATREENEATLGALDATPTFSIDMPGGLADAFSMGSYSWPSVSADQYLVLEYRATSVAPFRELALYLSRVFEWKNQTLIRYASPIGVVPLSARPAHVTGDFEAWTPSVVAGARSPAQSALAAVADIQRWLAIGQDQVATLASYAPRSVKNWREGTAPYPATVRRLFDLHALLGSLTQRMGIEGVRLWLADVDQAGMRRRDRLADDAGLRSVVSEASATLFEQPSVTRTDALDFDENPIPEVSLRPDLFSGAIRRARRRT